MTLDELVERIRQVAGVNLESPLLNTTMLIEIVLPRVMQKVTADAVRDENQLNALRADHTLSIVSGVVSCPATIKEEYADSIVFLSAPVTSYKTDALDFSNGSSLFDSFRVDSGNIHYRQAGLSAGIFSGTKTINAVTLPVLPTLSSDTVNLKDNLLQEVIAVTASLIKGEIPLSVFGLENVPNKAP